MTGVLPEPPRELDGAPRAFYEELLRMLATIRPARIDADESSAKFDDDGVEVLLAHAERAEWIIWASVGEDDAIAGAGWAHEHFFAPEPGETNGRPWTTEIVDFLAELLRGEIEIRTTYRGDSPITVSHWSRDERGEPGLVWKTTFLTPARLLVWQPKRTETERLSFL
ncbi:MAG TPA: hypothetical protein VD695_06475 [Gaiellaceae bacterium]|nr:hypothetical protein [Gaiellaceae bacterium]